MVRCKSCGNPIAKKSKFCPFCGRPNKSTAHVDTRGLGCLVSLVVVIVVVAVSVFSSVKNPKPKPVEEPGKQYESAVFDVFWTSASKAFGVEYSDYKWTQTATSYLMDFETAGGHTAHYYLIETAFETENVFGKKVLHPVTARCYYAPDYKDTVYVTYITLDGETVYFDEETENWFMNMDGGGTAP